MPQQGEKLEQNHPVVGIPATGWNSGGEQFRVMFVTEYRSYFGFPGASPRPNFLFLLQSLFIFC
jgi:hypothetical protein